MSLKPAIKISPRLKYIDVYPDDYNTGPDDISWLMAPTRHRHLQQAEKYTPERVRLTPCSSYTIVKTPCKQAGKTKVRLAAVAVRLPLTFEVGGSGTKAHQQLQPQLLQHLLSTTKTSTFPEITSGERQSSVQYTPAIYPRETYAIYPSNG